jgi:hypothetical protein
VIAGQIERRPAALFGARRVVGADRQFRLANGQFGSQRRRVSGFHQLASRGGRPTRQTQVHRRGPRRRQPPRQALPDRQRGTEPTDGDERVDQPFGCGVLRIPGRQQACGLLQRGHRGVQRAPRQGDLAGRQVKPSRPVRLPARSASPAAVSRHPADGSAEAASHAGRTH